MKPSISTLLWRGLRLRCPACGKTKLFRNWFSMLDPCAACGRRYHRAPGYLLGSIYFNYGVTTVLVTALFFSLYFAEVLAGRPLLYLTGTFSLLFPVWFFRYARALWITMDEKFDPWPNEQEQREMEKRMQRQTESG